ncbi:restriction endonuclease subunit S [Sellimonas intestinalis]|uniref:restriction endonuclease subunit S n=1 Tax=Sellimonas intestinalis TaxID=1653434 RepID=UPI0004B14797|nr:restriction endonuclease subunit S [Sellimonas intestinalis]UOX63239.1 restriction endonuclease subunit S [Sellimonas intestinalis]
MNRYKIGQLLTIKHGFPFKGEFFAQSGEYIILTPANFYEEGGFKYTIGKEKFYQGEFPKEYICKKDDLIVAMTQQAEGLLGSTALVPEDDKYLHNQRIGMITVNDKITDKNYVNYLFRTPFVRKQIRDTASGSKVKHTSPEKICEIEVYIPEIGVQKKIGSLLKALDSKIENNNKINAELELMAKTIYDYWFLQFEFPNEEGKPYKSSGGKMVWNEELKREIPEGWEVTTIGDVTVCHDSKRIPLTGNEREEIKGNIPYYGATGIMGYVNRPIFDGDYVLVAEDGSVMNEKGNPIIQRVSGKIWVNNHAHVLEPIKNYSCKLLMMILKDIPVAAIKTGSIQMKINQENLNKVKILDIPNEIKKQINKQFETIDKMILENNKENQELASLRDFLLPLLMNEQVGFKE